MQLRALLPELRPALNRAGIYPKIQGSSLVPAGLKAGRVKPKTVKLVLVVSSLALGMIRIGLIILTVLGSA